MSDSLSCQSSAIMTRIASGGFSLMEVLLMLTLLSATVLPCVLIMNQVSQNARDVYIQSTRSILLDSLQDEQSADRNSYVSLYSLASMNTSTAESGQVIPWRSVVDTTNAGASDTFQKTVYYYLYNATTDAANSPRYTSKVVHSRQSMRVLFNSAQNGFMDSSGLWWDSYNLYNSANVQPGINNASSQFNSYPAQAIANLPSNRDADIYRGGWYRSASSITYTAPVSSGLYTVKLYFAENSFNTRLMDIYIENKLMNSGSPYNAYYYCGNQYFCGNVQMFDVMVSDGNLDIMLSANTNAGNTDPYIQAISIKKRI